MLLTVMRQRHRCRRLKMTVEKALWHKTKPQIYSIRLGNFSPKENLPFPSMWRIEVVVFHRSKKDVELAKGFLPKAQNNMKKKNKKNLNHIIRTHVDIRNTNNSACFDICEYILDAFTTETGSTLRDGRNTHENVFRWKKLCSLERAHSSQSAEKRERKKCF